MIKPTTLISSARLDRHLGASVILASETFQHTGSFKFRGAWRIAYTVPNQHLLTASSGNFGQALAFACQVLTKKCTVVMPHTSVGVKVQAVRDFGGCVELIDVREIDREARVAELSKQFPDAYLASGYDSELMIAGNSTLGEELSKLQGTVDFIVVPVSGGGLASGVHTGLSQKNAKIPLIGVEPALGNHLTRSLRAGKRIVDERESTTVADGARVTSLGCRNWEILKDAFTDSIEIPEVAIREAVRVAFHFVNLKAEPTGVLSLAALLVDPDRFKGKRVCCVISGGNVDPELYAQLIS